MGLILSGSEELKQGALDAAIAYTKERRQFGKPISDFQGVQFMLADMAMKVEAARLMVITQICEGTNQIQRVVMARALLS
jgi:alkylation response protein AidB-like acyl-CoA dehydrogenase